MRILCAEDDAALREMLRHVLSAAGYRVDLAADGDEAYRLVCSHPQSYGLLITDHNMPRLDGVGLVERVLAIGFGGHIIVHTAGLEQIERERYQRFGVTTFIEKATSIHVILAEIASAVRRSAAKEDQQAAVLKPDDSSDG
jgi:two-component system OmpR family response regulator